MKDRSEEKEILKTVVKRADKTRKREWLPAGFGEREKQLRKLHRYSQEEVAEKLGTSISTISRLENGISRTVEIDVICGLADLYDVSTDFLLGKIRNPEKMYFTLKDIGLTPEAGMALYSGRADAPTVNRLLEDEKFQGLTYAIKDYLIYTPGPDGRSVSLLMEVCSDSGMKNLPDYCVTGQQARSARYARMMKGFYERGSVDALGEGLKTAVKQIRKNNESYYRDGVRLTSEMLAMIKKEYPKDDTCTEGEVNSPDHIISRILALFAPQGQLTETSRDLLARFRDSLMSMNLDSHGENDESGT